MLGECFPSNVIESGAEGSFLHTGIAPYVRQRKRGKLFAKGARKRGVQGRFLAALEMTVWGDGFISRHVAYNGYVWKALFPYRHPERSRGIFLAGGDKVVCVIAERGKPFAKGAGKSRVQGRFLAALEMTVSGDRKVQET